GWDVYGLRINVGSVTDANIYVYNNFVADIIGDGYSSPAGTWNTYGIFLTGSTNANAGVYIYHNSVHLFGVPTTNSPPLNSNPACLAISSSITGGVRVRNNIFQNTQTPAGTSAPGRTTLAISYGGTNAAVFAELDNNVYYVANNNGASSAFIGSIGSTRYATLNDWRTAVGGGREQNSLVLTAPGAPFVSNTNLHIPDGTVTPIEGAGVLITSPIAILGDIYGNARPEGSPNPDAGAVEFVQSIPPCPSTIDADQISISPPSLLIGTGGNFTVSVNNPSNVTQPAQWELSIDGGPWAVYAPYQGTSLTYTPSAAGTYSFRLVARVARYHQACPGIQNDTSNIVTGVVTCPASLNADQITVSPTSIPAGQAVTVTVQNPSAVTLPAQWQVSTDGGATWSVVAPYAGSPFFYSPTVLQTHQIRLAALPPTGCSSLSIAYSNVESFNVLPPAGNTINDPINITPQVPTRLDTTVNGNSAIPGYTDAYTGSLLGSSFNRTTPDVFYMYILRECLDSIRVSTCLTQSPYHDTYLHVLNISAGRSLHTDGGICGSGSTLMQATIRAFHDPNTTGSTSLTSTASGGMRLAAGDTLIIIVEAWSASYVGPFVLQVQEYRFDPNSLPSLPQPPFFSFDTSRVCYLGSIVRDSLNTGINTPGLSHVWYLNGQAVSGVTGPIYRPQFNAPGIYQVVAEIRSSSLSFCAPTQSIPRDTVYIVVDSLPKVDFLVDGSLYEHAQFVTLSGTGTLCAQYQASLSNPNFTYVWRINGSTYVGQGPHQECYASSQSADTVVLITTNGACVEIDSLYVILDITTGVETGFSGVRVFPNPAKDRFYVSSSRGGEVELRLLDMQGRLLLDKRIELRGSGEPYAVPVSLPGGLYLIEIRQGNKLSRTRLFIE
ncbi:MAG: T9SS type A sorting domain-containing protein, partial [Bacteroidia bacterium]|nr:T9SS type A sorting domain-containing protein [Bacteroidia bacterium]